MRFLVHRGGVTLPGIASALPSAIAALAVLAAMPSVSAAADSGPLSAARPSGPFAPVDDVSPMGQEAYSLGESIPECAAIGKEGPEPGTPCMTQTELGGFKLSTHVVHEGGTVTGTARPAGGCTYGGIKSSEGQWLGPMNPEPCPINWSGLEALSYDVRGGLVESKNTVVSGCGAHDETCTVRPPRLRGTATYTLVVVGITANLGEGITTDYFGIVRRGRFLLAGHVTDASGHVRSGVRISVSGRHFRRALTTDSTGEYNFVLRRGRYTVTAAVPGIRPASSAECRPRGRGCRVDLTRDRIVDFR